MRTFEHAESGSLSASTGLLARDEFVECGAHVGFFEHALYELCEGIGTWPSWRSIQRHASTASHGAGRVMRRTKAVQSFMWSAGKKQLAAAVMTYSANG